MPALVMSHLFMCVCYVAGVSSYDAHTALEWSVQKGYTREDGYVTIKTQSLAEKLSVQFNTIIKLNYKISYPTKNKPVVIDENGKTVFNPEKRFQNSANSYEAEHTIFHARG